ncbi:uncharacterized protein Nmag_1695 [Natrialba magadii ATCC 43099]|uniref:Uncharacterized protein n=1 Tax=Natrialba magadii (strain ATCC 43099 / DSM 3394 / CCM 3739 / CIP 104546 / IAM 13178 / JCM 8861 / NBRC 102185 / NCIMB 2190 / MS3) TaxID=547559 RepID=D3SUL3_NATMM|nr:hypothetical protein [Natrialba magadii]ADD05271.1 uncharacterized protein Nmag_1695 [Natrialba magadii ATCC 43099]ELY29007.1 hypothetical protein C500_11880 [Natrialba magadii ATCC 43099]
MPASRPPGSSDSTDAADDLLRCADVLGTFGVTATDLQPPQPHESSGADDLASALAAELESGRNRTAVLRQLITESERGLTCSARYAQEALERELVAVFDAIGWSFQCEQLTAALRSADRFHLQATDYRGRQRETTVEYPSTPLGTDNLPAILQAINASILAGTDAQFVLLSTGVDRWRAALVEVGALESLRDRYGERIDVGVDGESLLPEHGVAAYVPGELGGDSSTVSDGEKPWPDWAEGRERQRGRKRRQEQGCGQGQGQGSGQQRDRDGDRSRDEDSVQPTLDEFGSLIEEAEEDNKGEGEDVDSSTKSPPTPSADESSAETTGTTEGGEFELRGSPSVSRVSDGSDGRDESDGSGGSGGSTESNGSDKEGNARHPEAETSVGTALEGFDRPSNEADQETTDTDDFGSLSGTSTTARVSNDSFGSDVEWETEDDRYRALGAALGAGGAVSVRGLLEDDEFLPELPAAEKAETRIEFADAFDPAAVTRAKAAAEQSGFVWVESGSLETTRVSNS